MPGGLRLTDAAAVECGCDAAKIQTVHAYLSEHFPDYALLDFHAPVRLMQAGLPGPHAEHHVVRLTTGDVLPYYAVLLNEFQDQQVEEIAQCLRRWQFAATLYANRIAVAARDHASAL
jgi:hypothetical protein